MSKLFCYSMIIIMASIAKAQTPGYHLIIGNPDGSPTNVTVGDTARIPVYGTSPEESSPDSIYYINVSLASDDSKIAQRLGGFVPESSPVYGWDQITFSTPSPNTPDSGYTSQTMTAFADISGPPNQLFWSDGDTVLLFYFTVITDDNPGLLDSTVCPFIADGYFNAITPNVTVSCVHFIDEIIHDVGATVIFSPPETCHVFLHNPITLEVSNYGTNVESFDLICDIYRADTAVIILSDTINVSNLLPGSIDTLVGSREFSIYTVPNSADILIYEYDIYAYSILENDEFPENDTTSGHTIFINESITIVGEKDCHPLDVNIGSWAEIPVWGVTPAYDSMDTVIAVLIPVSSNDSVIEIRYPSIELDPQDTLPTHSYFPDTLVGLWDWRLIEAAVPDTLPDWSVQGIVAADWDDDDYNPICTLGDTVLIATFVVKTVYDSALIGDTIFAIQGGWSPSAGGLMWGLSDWDTEIYPQWSIGPIRFMAVEELGFITGTLTGPGGSPLDSVSVSLTDAFREDTTGSAGGYFLPWITPGIYSVIFYHPNYGTVFQNDIEVLAGDTAIVDYQFSGGCDYAVGDVNSSDNYNGLDITYGVAFFKGGPDPLCPDCPPCNDFNYCGDVNGSCNYNGLDITYGVVYFKGGPLPIYCADCPPQE